MKTSITRKEIQTKLNLLISECVNSLLKSDSKKIKKAIKKASKSIAKAMARTIENSDGQISIEKKKEVAKKVAVPQKQATRKKRTAVKKTVTNNVKRAVQPAKKSLHNGSLPKAESDKPAVKVA